MTQLEELGQPLSLAVNPEDADEVLAATESGLGRSRDGGRSWEEALRGAAVTTVVFDRSESGRVLIYVVGQGLMESRDGGKTWEARARAGVPED